MPHDEADLQSTTKCLGGEELGRFRTGCSIATRTQPDGNLQVNSESFAEIWLWLPPARDDRRYATPDLALEKRIRY